MAFDQNSISKDLRPLNVALTMAEEPLISPATTSSLSPNSVRELSYQPSASTSATGATWCIRPIAHPNVNSTAFGFNCFGNQVAAGNAWNLGNWVGASGFDKACNDGIAINGYTYSALQGARVVGKVGDQVSTPASHRVDQSWDDASDDSVSWRKVKFLCSFGGKILPRPSDGMLRYVGGETRIISFRKDVSFNDLLQKMVNTYGQPIVIKYQLPEEDLDALVSISCPDDVENMMEEYEKLVERSLDVYAKLRVFLFSTSELELSTGVQFGDLQDIGKKYVDAVNGITEGNVTSGGINRKESGASAASTQNSDFSGTETFDSLAICTGDVSEVPRSCVISPRENLTSSPNSSLNLVVSEPNASLHSSAFAVSLGMTGAMASPTQNRYFHNEIELQKFIPATLSHQPFGLQQFGMEISSPPSPYLQPFVDPSQVIINHADYVPLSPQIGFPNPNLVGKTTSVFSQQQFHDNTPGFAFHQVLPGVQMKMAQSSSHVGVGPHVIQPQPTVQPKQHHLDQYNDENMSGIRIIQFPTEHSYNRHQVSVNQVPSVIVGGNYGWVQVPPQEQVVFLDGSSPQQHVAIHEKIQRVEDCSLCKKKLPHAHSDPVPVVEDQHNSGLGSNLDSTPSYHSFPMDDNPKTQIKNKAMLAVTQPLNEVIAEQGAKTRPRSSSELDASNGEPSTEMTRLSHKLESQPNDGRNFIQNSEEFIQPKNSFLTDIPSEGFIRTTKVSCLDNLVYKNVTPIEMWIKQDALMNKPINNDIHMVDVTNTQTSECMVQEYPKEYTNVCTNVISKSGLVDNWFRKDHLKPIDGRIDTHKVGDSEVYVSNDHCLLPIGNKPNGNSKVNYNSQPALEEKVILDNNFGRSKLMVDANQINVTCVLPCSGIEILYEHNSMPKEYKDDSQPSTWGFLGPNSQSKISNHRKDDVASSSTSPSVRFGDAQDTPDSLFSNQDPWNIQHGTCFLPARPSKASLQKETHSQKDHFGKNLSNCSDPNIQAQLDDNLFQSLQRDLTLENSQPSKGSAEDQQLQAVAEDVAASALHPCTALNHDFHARDVTSPENIKDGDIQNNLKDVKFQDKTQDIKRKPQEKAKFGFPASNVGGLQVIKNCDLEELTELGSGTFGTVYHGKWRGSDVAIKRITNRCFAGKPSEQERMRNDFWNEAIKLADLHHPNVVAFYGVVLDGLGGSVATVTEYMVNGSLRNALQKSERNLDKRKRLLIAMDVAFGMEYLHGKNIVHFDLKSDNLLVNLRDPHRPICKV